ncbi:hypothetical protein [Flavobacterium sp. FlaQc-48]|uniref:hypothetical protein n=1 Tax=Flavobacterium sp. FlaQc-48 TaxID=3374181 RepID=UPI003757CB92
MNLIERISRNIDDFRKDTLNVDHFLTGTLVSYMFFKDKYPDILNEFNEKDRDVEEKRGMEIFKNLNLEISSYETEIYTFCFINLIARTEAFLNDILDTHYLLINQETTEENNELLRKTILKFSHSSFNDKIKFLKNNFNLDFPSIEEHKPNIIELFSTRNIILHNNGYVNETYLKINENSQFVLGTKRIIDRDYLKLTILLLVLIAKSIEEKTKELIKNSSH